MCEFDAKLIAWMDGELGSGDAREVAGHLESCETCAANAVGYREISRAFAAYYDLPPSDKRPQRPRRTALYAGSIAAAAAAAVLWMLPSFPSTPPLAPPKSAEPAPALAFVKAPPAVGIQRTRHRVVTRSVAAATTRLIPEPTVEIAIPADEIFAPGAFPAGFAFAADMSIGRDGSPEALRVRPASYLK